MSFRCWTVLGVTLVAAHTSGCTSADGDEQGTAAQSSVSSVSCDVVVAGGTTAALAAALTSAREGVRTCLLEPTDWPGGQLTAGGVPAIDFAWEGPYAATSKLAANLPSDLTRWLALFDAPI